MPQSNHQQARTRVYRSITPLLSLSATLQPLTTHARISISLSHTLHFLMPAPFLDVPVCATLVSTRSDIQGYCIRIITLASISVLFSFVYRSLFLYTSPSFVLFLPTHRIENTFLVYSFVTPVSYDSLYRTRKRTITLKKERKKKDEMRSLLAKKTQKTNSKHAP